MSFSLKNTVFTGFSGIVQNPVVSVWYYHMPFFSNVETQAVTKCVKAKIYSMEVRISDFFSKLFYGQFRPLFHKSETILSKHFFFIYVFFYSKLQETLGTCVNCVTNCVTPKRASVQLLHGQMKLDLTLHFSGRLSVQYTLNILYSTQKHNFFSKTYRPCFIGLV